MLRDVAGLILYSPQRLLLSTVALVALAVAGVAALDNPPATQPTISQTSHVPIAEAPVARPLIPATRGTQHVADIRAVRSTAARFLAQYVAPTRRHAVPRSLRSLATPSLWSGLQVTHAELLPQATVQGTGIRDVGSFSGTVLAELSDGSTLAVSVVAWHEGWRVSDVREEEAP